MDFTAILQNTLPVIAQNFPDWAIFLILIGYLFVQRRNGKAHATSNPASVEQIQTVAKENRDFYRETLLEIQRGTEKTMISMGQSMSEQTKRLADSMDRHNALIEKQSDVMDAIKNTLLDVERDVGDVLRRIP